MNITKVSYSRKFSLPNYENLDLSIEAQLNEKDNPLEVWSILADNTEMWFISERNKKTKPQMAPQQLTASPLPSPSLTPTKWEQMPPTEKGPWEKTEIHNLETQELAEKISNSGKFTIYENNVTYWLLKKDGKIEGVGRRVKA